MFWFLSTQKIENYGEKLSKDNAWISLDELQRWASFLFNQEVRRFSFHNQGQQVAGLVVWHPTLASVLDSSTETNVTVSFIKKDI